MAKQVIIAAMEEVMGEYILNMSKENMKIAAVRGKIKLDNVQLDGDLIGSHVLGAVGLSGFGVLSCWAKSIHISVPWKRLEVEPTRIEVRGIHLVCVPLTAATAHQMYGAGTHVDPRCSLRTRAKRLVLARMERNFWNGQIPGEGPPMKRITRAIQDIERDWKKQRRRRKSRKDHEDDEGFEEAIDNLVHDISETDSSFYSESDAERCNQQSLDNSFTADNLPGLPRDWKHKLRDKALRNLEASLHDVHIRCEVAENGLGVAREEGPNSSSGQSSAEKAFSFGITMETLVVRTASSKWEVGSHDKRDVDGSGMTSAHGNLGPNEYVVKNNKIAYFNNVSVYWDDEPALLLAETDLLQGNFRKVTPEKLHSRIASVMASLASHQEPGKKLRTLINSQIPEDFEESKPHQFVCQGLALEVRGRTSDRTLPGPISCSADVLPVDIALSLRPHQFIQYNQLKVAIRSQLRFDTMLRQRPSERPLENPRAWWKYTIACVTSRPNSRPWEDVLKIVQRRGRYIALVVKKNLATSDTNGYHAGLSEKESGELLQLEDLLPIEALSAFHIVALRKAYKKQKNGDPVSHEGETSPRRKKSGRFRLLRGSRSTKPLASSLEAESIQLPPRESRSRWKAEDKTELRSLKAADEVGSSRALSLLEAVSLRLGKKTWFVDWKLHSVRMCLTLLGREGAEPVMQLFTRVGGSVRSFGKGKRDVFLDVAQFEALHKESEILFVRAAESTTNNYASSSDEVHVSSKEWRRRGVKSGAPDLESPSRYLGLPPSGVVCRVLAGQFLSKQAVSLSAHPATLVWTSSLLSGLSDYFPRLPDSVQTDISRHVRAAATPLARKAQLALISPVSMSLHVNISAPKVWIPTVSKETQGALFLDSGMLKLSGIKEGGGSGMNVSTLAQDLQVKFLRGSILTSLGSNAHVQLVSHLLETSVGRTESSVVRPFSVTVQAFNQVVAPESSSHRLGPESEFISGTVRFVNVSLTPVCLNLVDAEVLARAFGKWYSKGVARARSRVTSPRPRVNVRESGEKGSEKADRSGISVTAVPQVLTFGLDRLEMVLEGHSKRSSSMSDERTVMSVDSAPDPSPATRTYLVVVDGIGIRRSHRDQRAVTHFSVEDASIVRLNDGTQYVPLENHRDKTETQHVILVRTQEHSIKQNTNLLSAALVHDGDAHLDEVEVDIDSITLRVTPTTLKDCAKTVRKIVEFTQILTTEMERKIHEAGRKARRRSQADFDRDTLIFSNSTGLSADRPVSHAISEAFTDEPSLREQRSRSPQDSSILFRVTVRESTVLVGRPAVSSSPSLERDSEKEPFAVLQVLSHALIMFQSVENPDASGRKTLHVSMENLSSLVTTEFERVDPSEAPPMIGPTGAEFRVVYATENLGCVVSQDVSLDCDVLRACLTPNDFTIMNSVFQKIFDRLQSVRLSKSDARRLGSFPMVNKYRKSGSGVATSIRTEFQVLSFVLLRTYKSHFGAPEFLDCNVKELKGSLNGCVSALSGEFGAILAVKSFNSEKPAWEYVIEPTMLELGVDQMPNELVLQLGSKSSVNFNLTGVFLRDISELYFDMSRNHSKTEEGEVLTSSALSTLGLRRATEKRSIRVSNLTGCDIILEPDGYDINTLLWRIPSGNSQCLNEGVDIKDMTTNFCLRFSDDENSRIGEREPVFGLGVSESNSSVKLCHLKASADTDGSVKTPQTKYKSANGRTSPETVFSDVQKSSPAYHAEAVVEWCMQNQRLRSNISDVFNLTKGKDLLSSTVWSPENITGGDSGSFLFRHPLRDMEMFETGSSTQAPQLSTRTPVSSNWLRPFLNSDPPEWTDMTCTVEMSRDRLMLPDSNWMWANDWTVDIWDDVGERIDSDGWEYEEDFEKFSSTSRYYNRGDSCRRRRWTRTRVMRPPRLDDPNRLLKFVWESSRDPNGNYTVTVRSSMRIRNATTQPLSFFVYSSSWDEDIFIGTAPPGSWLQVPVVFATAMYIKLAKAATGQNTASLGDCISSDRVLIVPSGYTSTKYVYTGMELQDVSCTTLHFLLHMDCRNGIMDITVNPILRIVNQLPCQIECQLGEVLRGGDRRAPNSRKALDKKAKVTVTESLKIPSGGSSSSTATNPSMNPQISLRVPGYKWSSWYRIVNRKANSETWRSAEPEADVHYALKGDTDLADEYKCVVKFERTSRHGDPLLLILSVENGRCPTLRLYAQYWILDKTGFGCRFTDGFQDLLGTVPETDTSRRSYLQEKKSTNQLYQTDKSVPGHQWSIGMGGMSLFFSKRDKLSLKIETGADGKGKDKRMDSKWISPIDISNVMPKTVISVDEIGGSRRFELAISVTFCPGIFGRSKLVTLVPRFQIVNLLKRELFVAQDGSLDSSLAIPSQSSVPFHWDKGNLAPKVRLATPSTSQSRDTRTLEGSWTNGSLRLDRIGITSLRIPSDTRIGKTPMVVQTEVRLATKDQSSAVVVVIWSANHNSNPLYLLRNSTQHTILCRQPLQDEDENDRDDSRERLVQGDGYAQANCNLVRNPLNCGAEIGPMIRYFLGLERIEEFVWVLKPGEVVCFGFDDPEKPNILEWTCVEKGTQNFLEKCRKAVLEVNAMGSSSWLPVNDGGRIRCHIGAEHSTKVIGFENSGYVAADDTLADARALGYLKRHGMAFESMVKNIGEKTGVDDDEEEPAFSLRIVLPGLSVSVVDNANSQTFGREILLICFDNIFVSLSQTREGYHEFETRLMSMQIDNHVKNSIHPVLLFCPVVDQTEPFLHMSAVRRIESQSSTFVFRYAAIRLLAIEVYLDRRTAEAVAQFIHPITHRKEEETREATDWVITTTYSMASKFSSPDGWAPRDLEYLVHSANSGRIYVEQLHLHPIRIALSFSQEWVEWNPGTETAMIFSFIRGMASIANAPLTFTSFVVGHVFEAPRELVRIIATHYASQLTKQIFGILGSLAILGAPADFITNVGTGVRDFFYEPINGAVHGPKQFLEGLEAGAQSLARGVFVGVVRGAANVTEVVNGNLAGLTADDDFIDERRAHQRMLTDAMSRGLASRTFGDSLYLAGASVARGLKSGAFGMVEQPAIYASKHGPVGFLKGVGKAMVGAVFKPVVGVGDAAVLVMNHMSDMTSNKEVQPKIPRRLRRALPSRLSDRPNCVELIPYDERAAKAQKIVTASESIDDVYIGHINIPSHLIIASKHFLWAIDRRSRDPWCINWEEVSHFTRMEGGLRVVVFSQTGLMTYIFQTDEGSEQEEFCSLLSMQLQKMGNSSDLNSELLNSHADGAAKQHIPGLKSPQVNHVFGSFNNSKPKTNASVSDEGKLIEYCNSTVKRMSSESSTFLKSLDEEAWRMVYSWGQISSGLSSRRCVVAGIVNGTEHGLQVKSYKVVEGGSRCYPIPSSEYDSEQGILHAGGCIMFFGWGVMPNLSQAGSVIMSIETNAFLCQLGSESRLSTAEATPCYQVGFLEKSFDESGWWAKYWLLVREID